MNGLFRKIKENVNLDAIEESDDEEEFEDMTEDKFVDIQKTLLIECVFNNKFKKWIPMRVVDNSFKVTHVSKLQYNPGEKRNERGNERTVANSNEKYGKKPTPYKKFDHGKRPYSKHK
jgi:hypothetical protein